MKKRALRQFLLDTIEKHHQTAVQTPSLSEPTAVQQELFTNSKETRGRRIYKMRNPPQSDSVQTPIEYPTRPLPECFNGDPNLQLPGIARRFHTHMTQTIFHINYRKPVQELIKRHKEEQVQCRGDLPSWDDALPTPPKNPRVRSYEHNTSSQLASHIMHYQEKSDLLYPTVFPRDIRRLLYVFHDVLGYPLHLWHNPEQEHIHDVALITGADDRQLLFCYKMALEQYLTSNPPLAPSIQSFPKRSNF